MIGFDGLRVSSAESGSVTAEFAAVVPAVILVLACCLGAVQSVGQQAQLSGAAADGSRSLARGDGIERATERVRFLVGNVQLSTDQQGDFICLTLEASNGFPPAQLLQAKVSATSCALAGGL